jgi:hypothetical protein
MTEDRCANNLNPKTEKPPADAAGYEARSDDNDCYRP